MKIKEKLTNIMLNCSDWLLTKKVKLMTMGKIGTCIWVAIFVIWQIAKWIACTFFGLCIITPF